MKSCFPLAASLLLAACVSAPSPSLGPQGRLVPGASAVFMQFRPGEKLPFKSKAAAGGVLTQRGRCLGIVGSDGRFATLYWPSTARAEVDARGLVVVDSVGGGRSGLAIIWRSPAGRCPELSSSRSERHRWSARGGPGTTAGWLS